MNTALESPTPSVVDAALRSVPLILPVLDFTTIKNELFPVIAAIFSKTNSLAIKVRGLQAFVILCGGTNDGSGDDGLDGLGPDKKKSSSSTALDKYTMQEKIVPLVKAIKTKEPAVMVAALNVLRVVGQVADADFVAMDILPVLWSMSLGPLLDLKQFQTFMELIKTLSRRVEDEQTRKLQDLSGNTNGAVATPADDFMSFGVTGTQFDTTNGDTEDDFERLVKGNAGSTPTNATDAGWDDMAASGLTSPAAKSVKSPTAPAFSWSTPSPTAPAPATNQFGTVKAQQPSFRTVTPDLAGFTSLTPSATQFSQPLQPSSTTAQSPFAPPPPLGQQSAGASLNWSTPAAATANPWASSTPAYQAPQNPTSPSAVPSYGGGLGSAMGGLSLGPQRPALGSQSSSSFSLPPPPGAGAAAASGPSGFSLAPPPSTPAQSTPSYGRGLGTNTSGMGMGMGTNSGGGMNSMMGAGAGLRNTNTLGGAGILGQPAQQPQQSQQQGGNRSGLDKYESLL